MYRNKGCLVLLQGLFLISNVGAADSFNPKSNQLSISSVTIGNKVYSDVVIQLDKYTVMSIGKAESVLVVKETCSPANITEEKYDLIEKNMSLGTVSQIVGCTPERFMRIDDRMYYSYSYHDDNKDDHTRKIVLHILKGEGVYTKGFLATGISLTEFFLD